MIKLICSFCGKEFKVSPSRVGIRKHCSRSCYIKAITGVSWGYLSPKAKRKISEARLKRKKELGYINSPKTRKKISEALKGKKQSVETVEKRAKKNRGKKRSKESRRRLSEAKKGKNNPFWKGGISQENGKIKRGIEFRLWREAIFARDNWTCQKCLKRGVKLHPHHIKDFSTYPELRFAIDNGITLCKECHWDFHKRYGKNKNNKKQLFEFLQVSSGEHNFEEIGKQIKSGRVVLEIEQ